MPPRIVPAAIRSGRAWLDAPTDLPEGTVVELVSVDDLLAEGGDWMDDDERQRLHEELERSIEEVRTGKAKPVDADVFLARLRSRD